MPAFAFVAEKPESAPAEEQGSLFALPPSRVLADEQISFLATRLKDGAQDCWEGLVQASALARKRASLLAKLVAPELREHPSRPAHLHRAVALELDLRQRLGAVAVTERWADSAWRALTPQQRESAAAEWSVAPERESLIAVVWTDWPPFSWPDGFAWEAEIGHLGWHEVAIWLRATGKSPPDPPRLGPALELAVAEGLER